MKISTEGTSKTEVETFTLNLPTDINIQPDWRVPVSKGRIALIYKTPNHDGGMTYEAYVVSVKTGVRGNSYGRYDSAFGTLHALKHWLQDVSAQYNVKRKTRKTVVVEECAEDGDDE